VLVCHANEEDESKEVLIMDTTDLSSVKNIVDVLSVPMSGRLD